MVVVIIFRGRNTAFIYQDFCKFYPVPEAKLLVCCRENDNLKEENDLTPTNMINAIQVMKPEHVVLVANGGTTAQQIPLLCWLVRGWDGWRGSYEVVEATPTGIVCYAHRSILTVMDKPADRLTKEEAHDLYHHTPW